LRRHNFDPHHVVAKDTLDLPKRWMAGESAADRRQSQTRAPEILAFGKMIEDSLPGGTLSSRLHLDSNECRRATGLQCSCVVVLAGWSCPAIKFSLWAKNQ